MLLFAIPAIQANAEDVSRPKQQTPQGISPDDVVVCEKGLEQIWKNDGTQVCVEPENVLKLVESGVIPDETIDQISISNQRLHKISENVYAFQFEYCAAVYNKGAIGMIVSSNVEKIPVQIDPHIQVNQCQQYGTQIHVLSDAPIRTSLFYDKDMKVLFQSFEKKKMNLEKDLVHNQQKLMKLQDPNLDDNNLEKIDKVKTQMKWINIAIQSYKDGLNILRSLQ